MNLSNPPVSFFFFSKRLWTVAKHLGPSNQFIFCFSLTTTTHPFFQPNQQRIDFVTFGLGFMQLFEYKKNRAEKCVYPMLHFSPDLDIQFFKHLEQVEGL